MGSNLETMVCVKQVKQEAPEEWDESMPLPGDIIEGIAEDDVDKLFMPAKARSELSSQLGKLSRQSEAIWVKVRRGNNTLKLQAYVVPDRCSILQRRFTIRAATDDRHVAILGDLTFEQSTELQEMSRRVVNVDCKGFSKRGVKYDWKMKMGMYLPDQWCSVVNSVLFMPMAGEHSIEGTTARSMAWFSAAVSSGAPLIFINIQTEQITTSHHSSGRETSWIRQKNLNTTFQISQGIRLWFLPGVTEVSLELKPEPGEAGFGMDIKQTDEGFICVCSVAKDSAADRAGLGFLHEQANATGYLVVISRLEGRSLMPSTVCSAGLVHCCDHNAIKDTLASAIDQMDCIQLHIMAWPNQTPLHTPRAIDAAALRPPRNYYPTML